VKKLFQNEEEVDPILQSGKMGRRIHDGKRENSRRKNKKNEKKY
jgi:hypothetical protein